MAKLTLRQRRLIKQQHVLRLKLEAKLQTEMRRFFKRHSVNIANFYQHLGLQYFDSTAKQELKVLLKKHYWRVARLFKDQARSNGSKYHRMLLEKKDFLSEAITNIDSRIKIRLEEYFEEVATEKADQITSTTESEISDYIARVLSAASADGLQLDRRQVANLIRTFYFRRAESRARSVAITETTRTMEETKLTEIEELFDELDEDQLDELGEGMDREELIAEIESLLAVSGADVDIDVEEIADSIDPEDIAAAGGIAAIVAALTVTKTWVATLDDRTREAHAEADGQTVGLDEPFNVDGEDLEYPGDDAGDIANTINCRCSVIYGIGGADEA